MVAEFETTRASPLASTPVPVTNKFAMLAAPSTLRPREPDALKVVLAARSTPSETVKSFCTTAEEPVPVT